MGGLTVAKAIVKQLPQENLIYFGDTAHLPYGDKSPVAIRHYAEEITRYLLGKGCKAIVVACNTASAHAYKNVRKLTPDHIPVFDVIDPVVQHASKHHQNQKIGIIATKGTIGSGIYEKKLKKLNSKLKVVSAATPMLVPMIEESFMNQNVRQAILSAYLNQAKFTGIGALILGCTHYPLIIKDIRSILPREADIIDSASITAFAVRSKLEALQLINPSNKRPVRQFFVSDFTQAFEKLAKRFFGDQLNLRKADIWS
ncbi:MAG: glutamate racemase [Flavobacteriales bacterium]|nr:glutamate racemase [Flavobacteriales bacterium]